MEKKYTFKMTDKEWKTLQSALIDADQFVADNIDSFYGVDKNQFEKLLIKLTKQSTPQKRKTTGIFKSILSEAIAELKNAKIKTKSLQNIETKGEWYSSLGFSSGLERGIHYIKEAIDLIQESD